MTPTPDKLNALLIGGGGREHALAWKLKQSPRLNTLYVSHPSNPGLAGLGEAMDVPFDLRDTFRIKRFCDKKGINLIIIGPEDPLAAGLADELASTGRSIVGPSKDGARLEADKAWAKQLMRAASIPTGEARIFTSADDAAAYLESREDAHVIKAAGLAKGKGVIVPSSLEEGLDAIDRIMRQRIFNEAGDTVIIEERLEGPEASVLALVDGRTIYVLECCQDHKRLLEGGAGPNTGGMGAFCPTSVVDDPMMARIQSDILVPTVDALRREGIEFKGILYAGLMLTHAGPKVLEFNVRFGDPECQPLMMRIKGDLGDIMYRTGAGTLADAEIDWDPRTACCIVMASRGYPEKPEVGFEITGVDEAEAMEDVQVFHAGTTIDKQGKLVTSGGRVLSVTALGDTLEQARDKALAACDVIEFEGKHLRRDIGAGATAASSR